MSDSDRETSPARLQSAAETHLRAATIGEPQRLDGAIELMPYDSAWPAQYQLEANVVAGLLGTRVLTLEHVGSTSVPGLAAKPDDARARGADVAVRAGVRRRKDGGRRGDHRSRNAEHPVMTPPLAGVTT